MKQLLIAILLVIGSAQLSAQGVKEKMVKGTVSHMGTNLVSAEVSSKNSNLSVKTNAQGQYEIRTVVGDQVSFSYPGMRTMEIVVEDVTSILNIKMSSDVNQLEEVVVEKTAIKSQKQLRAEYATNKNLINTAFGILDKEISNYSVRILEGKEIPFGGIDFVSAIQYRFPGIRVERLASDFYNPTVYLRGSSLGFFPAIYDVDGLILEQTPTFIPVENIERIAVLSGLGLVTKYGGKANGGVIVINTKGGNYYPREKGGAPYDQAKLRNNIFAGNAIKSGASGKNAPAYLQNLNATSSEQEAINLYREQVKAYGNSYHYLLDTYGYFTSKWKNKAFADNIISDNWRMFKDNPLALKALAYYYQVEGRLAEANDLYKKIFILRPQYAQSYMDLANSYREIKDYKKAATMYARYDYLIAEGYIKAEDEGFTSMMQREFYNLIDVHGKELSSRVRKPKKQDEFNGTRLVFEWNDSETEFELQFVNPEGNYYKWDHSLLANSDRIKDEKLKGYSSEEYLIDDSLKGQWRVNARYHGNKRLTPSYLKATIYHNYGSASQRKETLLFKLSVKDVNQELFSVSNVNSVVSN